jgi:hypothetical protein
MLLFVRIPVPFAVTCSVVFQLFKKVYAAPFPPRLLITHLDNYIASL